MWPCIQLGYWKRQRIPELTIKYEMNLAMTSILIGTLNICHINSYIDILGRLSEMFQKVFCRLLTVLTILKWIYLFCVINELFQLNQINAVENTRKILVIPDVAYE